MNKRILSLVLALVMVLGTFGSVFAAETEKVEYNTAESKIQWLKDNKIVEGRKIFKDGKEDVDFALDENVTRAEITKLVVYTLKQENLADALKGVMKPFKDVDVNHWANGFITVATTQRSDVAHGRRIVIGYPDGNFRPENDVTYAELATMLVRIVKKDLTDKMEEKANANWPAQWIAWAKEEGILDGLTIADTSKAAPRKDAFVMIFNAIEAKGDYKKGTVEFGDKMGIVSKLQAGVIELNQDKDMTYKITADTRITDGTTWEDLGANLNKYKLGSLVRLIADKDGNVTHIIELGNDGKAYGQRSDNKNSRWFSVADYTVSGNATLRKDRNERDAITVDTILAEITKDTRFFVADVRNNAFKEVKSLSDVLNTYYEVDRSVYTKVYMGYDSFKTVAKGTRNEAQVIVFGDIDKYQGNSDIRRVTRWLNSDYRFEAEDTNAKKEVYDIRDTAMFPDRNLVDVMDVVRIRLDKYNSQLRDEVVLIDYSHDNVYEVAKVKDREVILKDEYGYERAFYTPRDLKVFTGRLVKDKHVQVHYVDNSEIDIISIVTKDLKGSLKDGVRVGKESGFVIKVSEANHLGIRTVTMADNEEGTRKVRSFEVAKTDEAIVLDALAKGYEVVFDLTEKYGTDGFIFNVKEKLTQSEVDKIAAQKAAKEAAEKETKALKDIIKVDAKNIKATRDALAKANKANDNKNLVDKTAKRDLEAEITRVDKLVKKYEASVGVRIEAEYAYSKPLAAGTKTLAKHHVKVFEIMLNDDKNQLAEDDYELEPTELVAGKNTIVVTAKGQEVRVEVEVATKASEDATEIAAVEIERNTDAEVAKTKAIAAVKTAITDAKSYEAISTPELDVVGEKITSVTVKVTFSDDSTKNIIVPITVTATATN